MRHENYAQCKFYVYVSTDATADADSCSKFAAFILTLDKSELKIWIQIKHCLSSAKALLSRTTEPSWVAELMKKYYYTLNTFITINILLLIHKNTMSQIIHPVTGTKHHSPSMAGTQLHHRTYLRHHTDGRTDGPSLLELHVHGPQA